MSKNKNLYIVLATILFTIILCAIYQKYNPPQDDFYTETNENIKDSVTLSDGTKLSDFQYNYTYSEHNWYSEYTKNKVAFDKSYKDNEVDIIGIISKITNDYGCSAIIMRPTDNPFSTITLSNCPKGVDKFENQILEVEVGQKVRIIGIYNASSSSEANMEVVHCEIVK